MNNAEKPQLTIPRVTSSVSLNLFGEISTDKMKLEDWFIVPPFSILNSSTKEWQQKKKKWMLRINDKAQVRTGEYHSIDLN